MPTLQDEIRRRRTFAIISHPDAGKTTLTEKFLLYGGAIAQAGAVKGKKNRRAAVSDWMEIEKQRGISVTSSVMQFQYEGFCINILDTPGHQDFSEDTYRTLMAADSAVMVIDGSKGVEAQTRKLFKVCAMRHIPIFTFINKMDRESKDPFDLLDELEHELGIETYACNWPIGSGKEFQGVYDREHQQILFFSGVSGKNKAEKLEVELTDPAVGERIGQSRHKAFITGIQRRMLRQLTDADLILNLSVRSRSAGLLCPASCLRGIRRLRIAAGAGCKHQRQYQRQHSR